jgi:fatty-acyl-CoA synthase
MDAIDWLAKYELYSPDKTAIVEIEAGKRFTFQELNKQANRYAQLFTNLGLKTGDRVAVLFPNGAEILFVLFAATKCGIVFLPLNHKLAAPELAQIIENAAPGLMIFDNYFRTLADDVMNLSPGLRSLALDDLRTEASWLLNPGPPAIAPDLEAIQMLLYTSGTTGQPKGVMLSNRMALWNSVNTSLRMLAPGDTVLVHTPMFYTGGLNVYTLPNLYLGGTVAIMQSFNAEAVLRCVERERITGLFGVPTQLLMMAETEIFPHVDLSSLRFVFSGGAPCPVPLIERYASRGITLQQGYGLTEVGVNCFALEKRHSLRKAGSIGYPNFAMEARLLDDAGKEVAPGEVGELALRSPAMSSGYWKNPAETERAYRDGWFMTGDLASCDQDGCYYIAGRKKDMFISGGENVYPAEVETLLRSHPKILDAAVIGIPHEKWGEVGKAAVVLRPAEDMSADEVTRWCQGKIGKYKIPKSIHFLEQLPHNNMGKVDKTELRRLVLSGAQVL